MERRTDGLPELYKRRLGRAIFRAGQGKQGTPAMTQSEDITRQNIETFGALQKQLLDVLNKANHECYFSQRRSGIGFEFVQEDDDGQIDSRRNGSLPRVNKPADGTDDTASENNL